MRETCREMLLTGIFQPLSWYLFRLFILRVSMTRVSEATSMYFLPMWLFVKWLEISAHRGMAEALEGAGGSLRILGYRKIYTRFIISYLSQKKLFLSFLVHTLILWLACNIKSVAQFCIKSITNLSYNISS